ncbi:hypothetical protein [Pseudomonas sp. NPDC089734]|uniref:hypothetical protein n=1 Tax=Pseudomonas sp. NPDC089734 TaxID=3364469 RepID=UPI0037FF3B24
MKNTASMFIMLGTLGVFNLAQAEGPDAAAIKQMYDTARNTSGLVNYCVDKGFLKADSSENAKKMVAYVAGVPGGVDTTGGDKLEAYGREGKVHGGDGQYLPLEGNVPQGVEAWCKDAGEGLRQGLKSVGL